VKRDDGNPSVVVAELHVTPSLARVGEADLRQGLHSVSSRDYRESWTHAESSTVAMMGGSNPSGGEASSK
jgi:hypothetical protein